MFLPFVLALLFFLSPPVRCLQSDGIPPWIPRQQRLPVLGGTIFARRYFPTLTHANERSGHLVTNCDANRPRRMNAAFFLERRDRGNSGGTTRLSSVASSRGDQPPEKTSPTPREEALTTMRLCYRACFLGVATKVATKWRQFARNEAGNFGPGLMMMSSSSWLKVVVETVHTLNLAAFGFGLWRVTRLYQRMNKSLLETNELDIDCATNVCTTQKWMWRGMAWSTVGLSMMLAARIHDSIAGAAATSSFFGTPAAVAAIAVAGSIFIRTKHVGKVMDATKGKVRQPEDEEMLKTADIGYLASRNMALCQGSFYLFSALRLVFWLTTILPGSAKILVKVVRVNKFLTPFAIASLLGTLHDRFLDVVVSATYPDKQRVVGEEEGELGVYRELAEADEHFYARLGKALATAYILDILPVLVGTIKGAVGLKIQG